MWDAWQPRWARLVGEPAHAFQARELSIDCGIAGMLLLAPVDVSLELPGVKFGCRHRAEDGFEMETPARLYIVQRPMSIDAVIAEQVVGQLFDPRGYRFGLDSASAKRWRRSRAAFRKSAVRVDSRIGLPAL